MSKLIRLISRFLSVIIAFVVIVAALIFGGFSYFNAPPGKPSAPAEEAMRLEEDGTLLLEVRSGETADSVGRRLESAGVIKNRYFWYFLFRFDRKYIKTGTYRIELPASQMKMRSIFISGEQLLVKVTIPEGVTLKKAARILEEEGICKAAEFLAASSSREILDAYRVPGATMEGYLFPDTYLFPMGYPASRVVSSMADNFFKRMYEMAPGTVAPFGTDDAARSRTMNPAEFNARVIIASIVEREYRMQEEAALMAGVFYNRLRIGMALQSCATVEYVITEILGRPHPDILYNTDLEINDPYNTYMSSGLPPGPISAPGKTALWAAFFPTQSRYLYFRLIDLNTGRHYFSRTLDDHIKAGVLYLKGN
jgi:UPF0755 protein